LQLKIVNIENEMDVRVESLISQKNLYSEDFMLKLKKYKKDFEM
jgi:hypothetical protein